MVVGIDVYHDKSRKMGSIAGVVASLNDSLSRYFSTVAIQKQGQEIIDALKIAFMQSLIRYVKPTLRPFLVKDLMKMPLRLRLLNSSKIFPLPHIS